MFPDEEAANGLAWMDEPGPEFCNEDADDDFDDDDAVDNILNGTSTRLVATRPITSMVRTPFNHPEGDADNFFVGSC